MKREPLLADRFLARKHDPRDDLVDGKVFARVRNHLLEAKRFVLDARAAHYVGDFIDKVPQGIAHAQEFALAPFERMYVEVPIRELWMAVNHQIPDANSDTRVGYLIAGPRAYVLTESLQEYSGKLARGRSGVMPICYRLHQPDPRIDTDLWGDAREAADIFYWGTSYNLIDAEYAPMLRAHHSAEFIGVERLRALDPLRRLLQGSAGDLRNLLAIILFLNQTSKLRVEGEVPHARGMIGNKASTFVKHHVITLRVDPVPHLKRYYGEVAAQSAWRRLHDVRGHFCHDKTARERCNSLHNWNEYDVNQWRCLRCGGLRWWRKAHQRGHKEKGKVESSYAVVAQRDKVTGLRAN